MSMICTYRHMSAAAVTALQNDPTLAKAALDFDPKVSSADSPLMAEVKRMLKRRNVPVEEHESFLASVKQTEAEILGNPRWTKPKNPRFAGALAALRSPEATNYKLTAIGLGPADFGDVIDIDKSWHGLHFLLAGTQDTVSAPPGNVVLGGQPIGPNLGYGPARLFTPAETAVAARTLADLAESDLAKRYNPEAMKLTETYPGAWTGPSHLKELLSAFRKVRKYFRKAAASDHGMLAAVI